MPKSLINRFSGRYEFLSNFAWMPDGRTLEHYFQADKATNEADREYVMAAPNPSRAKKRGRTIACRADWDLVKNDVMLRLLRTKFGKEPFRPQLLATGDAELIEGNTWHDQYWGDCTCPLHLGVAGKNWLGRLLMQVREELKGDTNANQ